MRALISLKLPELQQTYCASTGNRGKAMKQVHTHYDNLKVARDAPPEVIRAAFKTLSHKFHPDRNGGSSRATQTFQLINTAYEVLSDPERRRKHDAWIARAEAEPAARPAAPPPPKPWNGRERRKRPPVAAARAAGRAASRAAAAGLRMPGVTAVLWASVALMGAMLVMLFQR